jgi:hypothetical protein
MSVPDAIRANSSLLVRAASLFYRDNSLFRGKKSLFHPVGNSLASD